ncbi:MAG: transcription-repair coupling factor, partial [Acidobacteriota bacterium]
LPPADTLSAQADYRVKGERIDIDEFCARLVERGYYRVNLVEEYGDFSRRGGVIDIYAPLYRWPLRLEFFDDELESIRMFHPGTQRSMGLLVDAVLLPASEVILDTAARERAQKAVYEDVGKEVLSPGAGNVWLDKFQEGHQFGAFESILPVFYEGLVTAFDYLASQTVLVWSDEARVRKEMEERTWKVEREWEEKRTPNEWRRPPSELFEPPDELFDKTSKFQNMSANSLSERYEKVFDMGARGHEELTLAVKSHSHKERLLEPVADQLREWGEESIRSFVVCGHKEQARRFADLLAGYGLEAAFSDFDFGEESFDSREAKVLTGSLERGFFWPAEHLSVMSEEEIFGRKPRRRRPKETVSGLFLSSFQDLHLGDYVVHVDHGIGVYRELVHLDVRGIESDFLLLEYQDGDKLYVPVDKLQKVQKYLGVEGQEPRVDKLGGKSWENAKKKARESAERIAEELLALYAQREVNDGFRFSQPDSYFQEFETTFSYEETPDQIRAIEDVLEDMASPKPMDRLICGDVGYGKTEVAIRAAFKAVMDGKQVAMLVPTTILAEQHYQSFKERFESFPVEVASLSRFKTPAQQKQVIEGLKKGTVDVVIGTHRLLQKDMAFKDLGLLIIDEEHRFGVKHKEKLKQLRASVDVLTLTATPIPRTLHMSLAGIRDLSTIETPPQDRHAIDTYVGKYEDLIVKEAIVRELQRNGQVFFVHNHVQSIYKMASALGGLVPEARVAVAHGQMGERDLEKVMFDFIGRKVDVLVCTTIIESGLDIPAANTIIINRADRFGLAQIYQLRGRVGRSSEQAYAYLLIPGEHLISRDAQKRLRALMDFSELGAGFRIALNDLQIRGGGTILGSSQSGHIAAVGYELYLELLERTIQGMKGGKSEEAETVDPEISVPVSAFLPDGFIPDTDQRLLAYKRLATLSTEEDVQDLAGEWRDRYGPFPDSVKNLVLLAKLRLLLKRFGIARLDGESDLLTLQFASPFDIRLLASFLDEKKCAFTLDGDRRWRVEIWGRTMPQRLARLKRILQELEERVSGAGQ